jgi:hypothetical protein
MSRPALAADLADLIEREVVPALQRALDELCKGTIDISADDEPNTDAILGALTEIDGLAHRLGSPEVKTLLERAAAGRG